MTSKEAYKHAKEHGPSEETRKIACENPRCAYYYAREVDKCPRDDMREAVCKNSYWAYWYAYDIDKCFYEDTWEAVQNTEWEKKYKEFFNSKMKEEII